MRETVAQKSVVALGFALLFFVSWELCALPSAYGEGPIRIVTGFEGSPATKVQRISDTHWVINVEDPTWKEPRFFLFRVEGAAGRTVTFDIPNAPANWSTLNPVYSYASSLDDLTAFSSVPVASTSYQNAPNGAGLPDTSGQGWQFVRDAKWETSPVSRWQWLREGKLRAAIKGTRLIRQVFRFSQRFDRDAYVCMRYPYTPGYNKRYLDSLTNNPAVQVITVGTSKEGRPLQVVKIDEVYPPHGVVSPPQAAPEATGAGEAAAKQKPCVLIYGREHPDEPDSSWVAQGAIEYLISDTIKASELRKQFTFLVIPLLDPDGVAVGVYEHIIYDFSAGHETPESMAYSAFFKSWVDKGNPLQLVLNLHNAESAEGQHVRMRMYWSSREHRKYRQVFFDHFLQPLAADKGFSTKVKPRYSATSHSRLQSWLEWWYGPLDISLEVDAQEPQRHLTIADLHQIGQLLVLASTSYLSSQEAGALLATVDTVRRDRAARWQKFGTGLESYDPFEAEIKCKARAEADADSAKWEALRSQH